MLLYPFLIVDIVTIVPVLFGLRDWDAHYVQLGFFRITYLYLNWTFYHEMWPFGNFAWQEFTYNAFQN